MASRVGRLDARPVSLRQVLADPDAVAENLFAADAIYGLVDIDVRHFGLDLVILWLTLEPWAPMAERDYPIERVSITVWRSGRIAAVPMNQARRTWQHIYPYRLGSLDALGELCLWYPSDPRSLRWQWDDGLAEYITVVHRHIQAEEYCRRNGVWPAEDAPHGGGTDGAGPHPIETPALRAYVEEPAA